MSIVQIDMNTPIIKDWYNFVNKGQKANHVRQEILKSWEKSKEFKIDPFSGRSHIFLSEEALNNKLENNQKLISIIEPYMNKIYETISNLGYLVFLTDQQGNLIYIIGDNDVLYNFDTNLNFRIGASWSEEAVGTTAVSMVMSQETSIPFMAEEKYCLELKKKACSAVPIRNIDNKMVAILGVAANFPKPNEQIFGMLLASQMAVENQLRLSGISEELHLINNYYKAVFNSVSDPIITVDSKGVIVDINKKALDIIGESNTKICGKQAREVLEFHPIIMDVMNSGRTFEGNAVILDTKDRRFRYSIKKSIPIYDSNNRVTGCMSILSEDQRISTGNKVACPTKYNLEDIICKNKDMEKIKKMSEKAAKTDYSILITGESGTGKELFAQGIHNASSRKSGPFIAVNCGAIPKELIESEFFGYETGSFTGAVKGGKFGRFELAHGGTIFLDEIGEMPKTLQIRLLRVLQEKEITRIGGTKTIPVDVRIIAATNKDLMDEVEKGNFREDLFWRINVITIQIPKLTQRKEDIPLLLKHFIKKHSNNLSKQYSFHNDTMDILMHYHWPGNVRELENVVERILAFTESTIILPKHLPQYLVRKEQEIILQNKISLDQIQHKIIKKTLQENNGNISRTAKDLGISRNTLYSKLKACNNC